MIILSGDTRNNPDAYAISEQLKELGIEYVDIMNARDYKGGMFRHDDEKFIISHKLVIIIMDRELIHNLSALYYLDVIWNLYMNNKIKVMLVRNKQDSCAYPQRLNWLKSLNCYYISTDSERYFFFVKFLYIYLSGVYDDAFREIEPPYEIEPPDEIEQPKHNELYDENERLGEHDQFEMGFDDIFIPDLLNLEVERLTGFIADLLVEYYNLNDKRIYTKITYLLILMRYICTYENDSERRKNNTIHRICNYIKCGTGEFFLCVVEEQCIMEMCFLLAFNSISHYNYYA